MASQTTGIQQLLAAEKIAGEKVSESRKRKNRRLKQAKEEGQAEIDAYKTERERQFKDRENKFHGSRGDAAARIESDTASRISHMDKNVNANKQRVITTIIDATCDIKPKVHKNFRG